MRLTRRRFLGGAATAALGGGGIYELVDRHGSAPARPLAEPAGMPAEELAGSTPHSGSRRRSTVSARGVVTGGVAVRL